ncbi:hypothetical protein KZZ52_57275 [Dactylosporangium sp. AC04546]|uniref:hypothetical protein n=1 Tax=Dactylosporangium sp. AC04546 TaxID=2862460 RepID=UPI002E7B38A6|nr:hypothetical protein [Dactylosporangium sp. AC04546]WVK83363.1 hypothetical protein KZZ52_57275 [Dactylosporangium sp. AC04546]
MSSSSSGAPLPIRWAMILVIAMAVGTLVGILTYLETGTWPATLLAAFGAAGAAVPTLHKILGP